MKIIAGLGNPGPKYETTRHNLGFLALDRLIDEWRASGPVMQYEGEVYKTSFAGEKIALVKPQTFMNLSGKTIAPLFNFNKCAPEDLIVLHDELDLPAATIRIKTGGGAGGHNGIKSIDESLGREKIGYHRVRLGIGHPSTLEGDRARISPADYVLQPFTDQELGVIDAFLGDVVGAVEMILRGDLAGAQNKYHSKKKEAGV